MDMSHISKNCHGFSLVELLIYMVISGIVAAAIYFVLNTSVSSYFFEENIVTRNQDQRAALDLMVREIRMAGCDPTAVGGIGFNDDTDVTPGNGTDEDSVRFIMDITDTAGTGNPDGAVDNPDEDISYYIDTIDGVQVIVRRTADGNVEPLAEHITDLGFRYWNAAGAELVPPLSAADLDSIASVEVSMTAETAQIDKRFDTKRLKTTAARVEIRNEGLL